MIVLLGCRSIFVGAHLGFSRGKERAVWPEDGTGAISLRRSIAPPGARAVNPTRRGHRLRARFVLRADGADEAPRQRRGPAPATWPASATWRMPSDPVARDVDAAADPHA